MFVFTNTFDSLWKEIFKANKLSKELDNLEKFLLNNPKSGAVIKGTNGLRKLRWNSETKGKRGGIRILYLDIEEYQILFLISLLKKNEKVNLTESEKSDINKIISNLKQNLKQYYGVQKNKK
ncbi:MAG TPA: hypothetical protein PLG90_13060 [Ignavibacteria bacterium]|nr:hypothetical protein [Ignavibacteria bacterium]